MHCILVFGEPVHYILVLGEPVHYILVLLKISGPMLVCFEKIDQQVHIQICKFIVL